MTLRRFMVLVRGLGPNSATAIHHAARNYLGSARRQTVVETTSAQDSENALAAAFGFAPTKVAN